MAIVGECLDTGLVHAGRVGDLRVAGESARFGFSGLRLGLGGDAVIRSRLLDQIPYTSLMWLVTTGQEIGAEEAMRIGLVNEVVPDSQVFARARELAEGAAAMAPMAIMAEKRSLDATWHASFSDTVAFATGLGTLNRMGSDAAEGIRSFAEKRKPNFTGMA
jgi:enoyl-CoA hydratase/carnithine racemase